MSNGTLSIKMKSPKSSSANKRTTDSGRWTIVDYRPLSIVYRLSSVVSDRHPADWLWLALIGLLVQGFWALQMDYPSYTDAYYYTTNGQRLAQGHGFTEQIIWLYLDDPAGLPTPSHTYWMPLASLLAAGGYLLHDSFRGAQLIFWLLAGLLPLLAAAIVVWLGGRRWQFWMAGLLTVGGGFYAHFLSQPSTFAPFAWAGGGCLLALAIASGQDRKDLTGFKQRVANVPGLRWWLLAGVLAGLAHLTRADGLLLLGIGGLIWLKDWRNGGGLAALLAGYGLVMGGWLLRNGLVLGTPLPTGGTQAIFLTTYADIFSYGRSFDLAHLLAWGWPEIIRSRLHGLSVALQTFVAVSSYMVLTPFVIWGWLYMGHKNWPRLAPMSWYALALLLAMSMLFTLPGSNGGLFHSSTALWPWFMALAAIGLDRAVDWLALRRTNWRPEEARRVYAGIFVVAAFGLSLLVGLPRGSGAVSEATMYGEIEGRLPATAVTFAGDAPAFHYHTGLPALSAPNEPAEVMLQMAQRYGATHLLLDSSPPPALAMVYTGEITVESIQLIVEVGNLRLYRLFDE
jgi:hypothetical protein